MPTQLLAKWFNKLYVAALLAWCLVFGYAFITKVQEPGYFAARWMDFSKFYAAAQILAEGNGRHLYDPHAQRQHLLHIVAPTVPLAVEEVNGKAIWPPLAEQPPYFLMLYVPLTFLPPPGALFVATAVFWLFGVLGLLFLCRVAKSLSLPQSLALVIGCTASAPAIWTFVLGHASWLMLAIWALVIATSLTRHDTLAGTTIAASAIKPQYATYLLLIAVCERRYCVLVSALIGLVALLVVSWCLIGNAVFEYVPLVLLTNSHPDNVVQSTMPSLRGVLTCLWPGSVAIVLSAVFAVLVTGLIGWLWWRTAKGRKDERWCWAATILATILFNVHTYRYDLLLLALPAALTLRSLNIFAAEPALQWIWKAIFVSYPVVSLAIHLSGLDERLKTAFLVGLEMILLVLSLLIWKRSKGAPDSKSVEVPHA